MHRQLSAAALQFLQHQIHYHLRKFYIFAIILPHFPTTPVVYMRPTPLLCSLLLLLVTGMLTAQDEDIRFGRVSDADRQLMHAPSDSTAEAYVLYDKMYLDFTYREGEGPGLREEYHRRVKLLTPASFDRADVELVYYHDTENLNQVKAVIHLPEGGTIKLRKSDIIQEKINDKYSRVKFTFPRVVEGAILEYAWVKTDENILMPSRYTFQEDIPVRWAEFTGYVPGYYNYISLGSNVDLHIKEVNQVSRSWGPNFNPQAYGNDRRVPHAHIRWVGKDLSAFEPQPYTNNMTDYLAHVRLQLQSVRYPGQPTQPVFKDWKSTAEDLDEQRAFGRMFRTKSNFNKVWKEAEPIVMAAATPLEKIYAAYYFVANRISWNGKTGLYASDTPDKIFDAGIGNSADLNVMLLALLNEAGIKAYPLLVGFRDRGAPVEMYPIMSQFDHLMAYTEVDGQPLLLDANTADRPPGLPRINALNHRAWVLDKKNPRWVSTDVPHASTTIMATMEVSPEGMVSTDLQSRMLSYFAFECRGQMEEVDKPGDAPLALEVAERFPETRAGDPEVEELEDPEVPGLIYTQHLDVPAAQAIDDYLYVQPILLPMVSAELKDVDRRLYPVDFPYPWRKRYIAQITLPEGYTLEEMPKSIRMRSEDGGMTATFATNMMSERMLQIMFSVALDRTVYRAADYDILRHMFDNIIELQETTLVLRKAK